MITVLPAFLSTFPYALDEVVYSEGNLKLCEPPATTRGRLPAFGITFHDRVRVTFWWFLKKKVAKFGSQ